MWQTAWTTGETSDSKNSDDKHDLHKTGGKLHG